MKKRMLIWVHVLFWLYIFVFVEFVNVLARKNRVLDPGIFLQPVFLSNLVLFTGFFYLNYCLLLPVFFKRRKFLLLVCSWFALSLVFVGLRFWVQEDLFVRYLDICNYCYDDYSILWGTYTVNNFFQCISYLILPGTIIWFVDSWLRSENQRLQLQEEKVAAERVLLQSQVSPHFLFNSLNNIYSMVFHHSENSLPAIQKLSNIMRYMTADSGAEDIPLAREINYVKDYIELQQYRSRSMAIDFRQEGEPEGKLIAPLILISFVENAFKHGVTTDPANPVQIGLTVEGNRMTFTVRNKINHHTKDPVSGIGLKNIRSRLALQYGGRHKLEIRPEENAFTIHLEILLKTV
ncbi:sensor histidine kinase [Chitinophaga lutea]|nr:histidine kinase [Chitinophaga lutea]